MTHSPVRRRLLIPAVAATSLVGAALVGLNPASAAPATAHAAPAATHSVAATGGTGLDGVFLSEVNTHGVPGSPTPANGDFIELHNTNAMGTTPVSLAGAIISDSEDGHAIILGDTDPNTDSPAYVGLTSIDPGAYVIIQTDNPADSGDASFSLGDQDEARLYADGSTVGTSTPADEFDWNHSPVYTWARDFGTTDPVTGTFAWTASEGATAGTANAIGTPSPTASGVVINEVNMNGNAGGADGDYIELYNTNSSGSVDLTGAILSDNDNTHAYIIGKQSGDTVSLDAGKWATYLIDNPDVNGSFGLGDNDSARLFSADTLDLFGNGTPPIDDPANTSAPTLDSTTWPNAMVNTWVRLDSSGNPTDGGPANPDPTTDPNAFGPSTGPTENVSNTTAPARMAAIPSLSTVRLNEVKTTADSTHGDWIELINTSTSDPATIANAILSDNDDGDALRIPADTPDLQPAGSIDPATGKRTDIAAFRVDDPTVTDHFGLGDADSARLFNADAINLGTGTDASTPIDSFTWTQHQPSSWGRNPDGTGTWEQTGIATFGAPNIFGGTLVADPALNPDQSAALAPDFGFIQLNEIESNEGSGDPVQNDYVELINTASSDIDVAGAVLSDNDTAADGTLDDAIVLDSTNTLIGAFPGTAGTDIPAGGFALVKVDPKSVTGHFGLGSNDSVELFAPEPAGDTDSTLDYINSTIPEDHDSWADHAAGTLQRQNAGLGDWSDCSPQTPLATNAVCSTVPK